MFADKLDDLFPFIVGNKCALNAQRFTTADRRVEHVSVADQFIGSTLVQNNPAFKR